MNKIKLIKNALEINQLIFLNILNMLKTRGKINDIDNIYKKHIPKSINNKIIDFKSDISNDKFSISIISSPLSSISKSSSIDEYLSQNILIRKILVLPKITKKVFNQIESHYPNSEVFTLLEMIENITLKDFIPKHKILNKEEKEIILKKYKSKNLPKIQTSDVMIRYLDGKENDIVEITRNNINSGISIVYRLIIKGNIDYYFK